MNTRLIYIIGGIFAIATLGYALDSWNEFESGNVASGQPLTATMLNTLYHNIKNLTDVMHSEGGNLKVSGRIKASDPVDNDDIATKGWVEALDLGQDMFTNLGVDGAIAEGTYYANGGDDHFCKKIVVDSTGKATLSNINEIEICGDGKNCHEGYCIPLDHSIYSDPRHDAATQCGSPWTPDPKSNNYISNDPWTLKVFCEDQGFSHYYVVNQRSLDYSHQVHRHNGQQWCWEMSTQSVYALACYN